MFVLAQMFINYYTKEFCVLLEKLLLFFFLLIVNLFLSFFSRTFEKYKVGFCKIKRQFI